MKYVCNPMNIEYKYQFFPREGGVFANREAADPSLVLFKGKCYLFPSMTDGFLTSEDLVDWTFHSFNNPMPIHDYAPDVCVSGDYLYFSASKKSQNCSFYRTTDPIHSTFEEIEGTFPFWDPHLFTDDDGRMYFYWGCSNAEPIYGLEVEPETMKLLTEKVSLISHHITDYGYERIGDDHIEQTDEEIEARIQAFLATMSMMSEDQKTSLSRPSGISEEGKARLYHAFGNAPYVEGPWMTKHNGKYYLQYAVTGAEYNVYSDGVYIGDSPLGPFTLAKNNPYSYKPGGFINGAGHGSTIKAESGQYWHTSTMRISKNHNFERRLGIWQAGFDAEGDLFCDQRYGDWPIRMDQKPWDKPNWMLLSYGKNVEVSSGTGKQNVTDENVRTWWKAETNQAGEWLVLDLEESYDVHGIQVNFADDQLAVTPPVGATFQGETTMERYIDPVHQKTRWVLEGSLDGGTYFTIEDKSQADTDLSHDFIVREKGIEVRYLKLTIMALPYNQNPCVSGLRVFGKAHGELPAMTLDVKTELKGDLDMLVSWQADDAVGHNILWGYAPSKLYHSYMVFGKNEQNIGAIIKGTPIYVRVDTFNEVGITEGHVIKVR